MFLIGYVLWSLTEYFGHRYLFHVVFPLPFGLGRQCQFLLHGVHHHYPSDPFRLVMPLIMSVPIMATAFLLLNLIAPPAAGLAIFSGYVSGYILYDCIHYWTHTGKPRTRLGRLFKRLHMQHHFVRPDQGFGVHAIWCDYIFGTSIYSKQRTPSQS